MLLLSGRLLPLVFLEKFHLNVHGHKVRPDRVLQAPARAYNLSLVFHVQLVNCILLALACSRERTTSTCESSPAHHASKRIDKQFDDLSGTQIQEHIDESRELMVDILGAWGSRQNFPLRKCSDEIR